MIVAGEDPRYIARRLVILASEDIGMADPTSLLIATAAAHAVEYVGLPEAQLNLAQAVVHLATAPKSNRTTLAIWQGPGGRPLPAGRASAAAPARRPLQERRANRPRRRLQVSRTTTPAGGSSRSTYPRSWRGPGTTNPRSTAAKPRSASDCAAATPTSADLPWSRPPLRRPECSRRLSKPLSVAVARPWCS